MSLEVYPWIYRAEHKGDHWEGAFVEKEHLTPQEEAGLSEAEKNKLLEKRNRHPDLSLVNYATQYGYSCFEGIKAFPQKSGGIKIFRLQDNVARMGRSMKGLMLPAFEETRLYEAIQETLARNAELGFTLSYDPSWEKEDFVEGASLYIRPFTYSEGGIGLNIPGSPWLVIVMTPFPLLLDPREKNSAITTEVVRASPGGIGELKCAANYAISILMKKKVNQAGFSDVIFLDSQEKRYVDEASASNFFCVTRGGTVVTPSLEGTILAGITRQSVLTLAREMGHQVEERRLSIDEVMEEGEECFICGTAMAVAPLMTIEHKGKTREFAGGKMGPVTHRLLRELKSIQYGFKEDRHGWLVDVPPPGTRASLSREKVHPLSREKR